MLPQSHAPIARMSSQNLIHRSARKKLQRRQSARRRRRSRASVKYPIRVYSRGTGVITLVNQALEFRGGSPNSSIVLPARRRVSPPPSATTASSSYPHKRKVARKIKVRPPPLSSAPHSLVTIILSSQLHTNRPKSQIYATSVRVSRVVSRGVI